MKMSDVFVDVMHRGDTLIGYDHGKFADFSGFETEARYAAHAINNHDRMVEEIAELKSILKKFIPANDYHEDDEDDYVNHGGDFTYDDGSEHIGLEVVELLAKLNQEGEE